jgi:tripartite-type tricarboxylate transporter receptor subunit TctC
VSGIACAQPFPNRPVRLIVPYPLGGLDASSEQGSRLRDATVRESDAAAVLISQASIPLVKFPNRPIRLIVPYPPGGGSDVIARILAPKMSEDFGQQVVIDNRAGAATIIGLDMLAKSPPDGYTFGIATSTLAVNSTLNKSLPFDTLRDFAPVMLAADGLYVLVVHPSVAAKSVRELVALAKSAPGKLNSAIAGSGTPMHMGLAQFNSMVGVRIPGVIYKGAGPALTSLIGGETQMAFISMPTVAAHIQAGKLRALAVTGERRSEAAPGLPTVGESGLPGFALSGWYGFLAPAKTAAPQIDRLNAALRRALAHPDVKQRLLEFGADVVAGTPAAFGIFLRAEIAKWGKVVREANIQPE